MPACLAPELLFPLPMTEARVAASYVQLLYEHLAALGLDAPALLGPAPAAGEHFVALKRWQALLQRAQALDPGPPATFALRLQTDNGLSRPLLFSK